MTRCRSSTIGGGFWLFGASYCPITIILRAATFVEYWKVVKRMISVWRWELTVFSRSRSFDTIIPVTTAPRCRRISMEQPGWRRVPLSFLDLFSHRIIYHEVVLYRATPPARGPHNNRSPAFTALSFVFQGHFQYDTLGGVKRMLQLGDTGLKIDW